MSALGTLGGRIGRHTAVYGSGSFFTLFMGLVQVAVLTRFLPAREFGELAVFLIFSALLTIVYNAGSLQGAFTWVFGSTGEEEIQDAGAGAAAADKARALGSALVLTFLIAAGGTAVIALLAPQLSYLLVGSHDRGDLVVWAAASGGLGALWRLASHVLRLERRPTAYVLSSASRPTFVLAIAIPLVAAGGGVEGALAGVALGTALSVAVTLTVVRRNFRLALRRVDVVNILRLGAVWVPVIVANWVTNNGDLLLLAQYAPEDDVGLYRVASRVGAVVSYLVSGFLMAWGSLAVDAVHAAVERERGLRQAGATVATYFTLVNVGVVVGLAVFADLLVRIAPPEYSDAAPLIPLIGLGYVLAGAFIVVYRIAAFPRKRLVYVVLSSVSALVFIGAAVILIPWWGSYGAAASVAIAPSVGAIAILALAQSGDDPIPFQYGRMLSGIALGGGCLVVARLGGPLAGELRPAVELAAFLAFPVLLVGAGVVPRSHLRTLKEITLSMLPFQRSALAIDERLAEPVLAWLAHRDKPATDGAARFDGWSSEALAAFVGVLRKLGDVGDPSPADARIGAFLVSTEPVAKRNEMARRLWTEDDVDPLELDSLTLTLRAVRRSAAGARRSRLPHLPAVSRRRRRHAPHDRARS